MTKNKVGKGLGERCGNGSGGGGDWGGGGYGTVN